MQLNMRNVRSNKDPWALPKIKEVPNIFSYDGGLKMKRWSAGRCLLLGVIGILFMAGDIYPAIRSSNLEGNIGIIDNKPEEMLQELTKNRPERGMTGDLTADLEKALWFSSNKETIKAKGEIFQDTIGYSEVMDLKTAVRKASVAAPPIAAAEALILSRPQNDEIKKEMTRRGLDKKVAREKGAQEPLFSMLRVPEREEISVPVGEDSALPYTSILLVSLIIGSLVSFMLTCTWCTWALPSPGMDVGKETGEHEEMDLAA